MDLFDSTTLIAYCIAAALLVLTPGPGQAVVIAYSIGGGRRHGILASLGLEVGTLCHTFAAALGLSAILATSATAFAVIKFVGAAYLIYLGVKALTTKHDVQPVAAETPANSGFRVFAQAATTGLLNPKVALFFLAFLPQFVRPERGFIVLQFMTLGVILASIGFIFDSLLALTTGYFGGWLNRNKSFARWRERVTGVLLIGIGVRLALTERS